MSDFEIIVGISSIGSFIVAIIALFKVNKMEKQISIDQNNKTRQIIKKTKIENLKLINKELNELIVYNGKSYVITNIIDKYAYVFRHVESQIDETKNGSIIKKIYLRADENIGDQLSSSFIAADETDSLLLSDDLFFRKLGNYLGIGSVNHTFLYDSLEGDKYYEAIKRLLRTNYSYIPMPNINSSLLTEYCESIVSNDRKKKLYAELLLPLIKD